MKGFVGYGACGRRGVLISFGEKGDDCWFSYEGGCESAGKEGGEGVFGGHCGL